MQPATQHSSTRGYYHALTIAVFPLAIYALQILGKFSTVAAWIAGLLIVLKVIVEWQHHVPRPRSIPRRRPSAPSRLVPVQQAPLAGCYLCKDVRPLREYHIAGHRVGICQPCYHYVPFTNQRTSRLY